MWYSFWDSYESTIHKNEDLANVDNFHYLNSLLKGSACEAVSGLTGFGSKQQIISRHMDILLHVEPVASLTNIKALRHLHALVESHIRGLKALGVASDFYGSLLSPALLNKLPTDVKLIVSREVSEKEWSLDALIKEMREEIEARERIATNQGQTQQRRTSERSSSTAAALVSGASPGKSLAALIEQLWSCDIN